MTATLNIISADKNSLVQRVLASDDSWATLALRVPVGIIFAAHGAQKLFGMFGGYGLDGTGPDHAVPRCDQCRCDQILWLPQIDQVLPRQQRG